jgi:hypothetical protein
MDSNGRGVALGLIVITLACAAVYAGGYVWMN